ANDTNGVNDLFIRDLSNAQTVRVSLANDGSESNGETGTPDPSQFGGAPSPTAGLSGGGRLVAFTSAGTNLVADDRNLLRDVFLRDRQAATTTRLSLGLDGINPNGDSFDPDVSLDGTTVAFASEASNLVVNDTNDAADIFAVCSDGTVSASCGGISDPPVIVVSRLRDPQVGALYSGTLLAVGGSEPYFWTLQEGALPPGLSLDPLSGRISGVPQQAGQFRFTVLVLDSGRPMRRSQRTFTLVVR
ncbi:Ig domain-containing protein, partial [Acidobacteriia bacterium AH_259_A11_L15]|nr:Ig domain-containing protein [Acidobacteriia bacterium AH_259_A11_L15]